jgi:hypothetical protein
MTSPPIFETDHWRIRSDTTVAEGGTPVWETTEDQAAGLVWLVGNTFRIRFVVSETGGNRAQNDNLVLQYQINTDGWNDVGDNGTTAEGVIYDLAASTSADQTLLATEILTAGQGSVSGGGQYVESITNQSLIAEPDASEYAEYEYGIILDGDNTASVSASDAVTFRLTQDGSPITANYANVPTIDVPADSAPDAPTSLTATATSGNNINLSWTEPASDGGQPILGYRIDRESPTGDGFSIIVANTGSQATTYQNTGLVFETQYNYEIYATNSIGNSLASNEDSANTRGNVLNPSLFYPGYF